MPIRVKLMFRRMFQIQEKHLFVHVKQILDIYIASTSEYNIRNTTLLLIFIGKLSFSLEP